MKIAISMPGKTGDAMFILPTVRKLCDHFNCKADFYTSKHLERARDFFEFQTCIDKMIIPDNYVIERYDMGIQPWRIPIPLDAYTKTYHLGYRSVPDCRLDYFIAKQIGINLDSLSAIYYDYPHNGKLDWELEYLGGGFYLLAGNGETSYKQTFLDFIKQSPIPVLQIGLKSHYLQNDYKLNIDYTGISFLDTLFLMGHRKCRGFVGLMTNQLVLANGFNIPKVAPHDGKSWDMRHVVYSDTNFYPINPTAEEILNILENN